MDCARSCVPVYCHTDNHWIVFAACDILLFAKCKCHVNEERERASISGDAAQLVYVTSSSVYRVGCYGYSLLVAGNVS